MNGRMNAARLIAQVGLALALFFGSAILAFGQVGGGYDLSWFTVDTGGGTFSTGGAYSVGGTAGQPDAGQHSGGQFSLQGGFWAAGGTTPTATATATRTATAIATSTSNPSATNTTIPSATATATNTATNTSVATSTNTPMPTSTATSTLTPTVAATATSGCALNNNYLITPSSSATIVPATNQVFGSVCNACTVNIPLPFAYSLYDTSYTSVNASNKGNLQFTTNTSTGANSCLPDAALGDAIFAYWDDLNTNINDTMGIYTSVSGVAPNRIFNIRWHAGYEGNDAKAEFEVRLYEGLPKFEIIYGLVTHQGYGASVGVQKADGTRLTQYECNTIGTIQSGMSLIFDRTVCPQSKPK